MTLEHAAGLPGPWCCFMIGGGGNECHTIMTSLVKPLLFRMEHRV
jgi:hypothetical protein